MELHNKGFPFKQGTQKLHPSFFAQIPMGKFSDTKLQTRLRHAISLQAQFLCPGRREEGTHTEKRDLVFRYLIKVALSPSF